MAHKTSFYRRNRLMFSFCYSYVLLLLLTCLFGFWGYSQLYRSTRERAQEQFVSSVTAAVNASERCVSSVIQTLNSLSINRYAQSFAYARPPLDADANWKLYLLTGDISALHASCDHLNNLFLYYPAMEKVVSGSACCDADYYFEHVLGLKKEKLTEAKSRLVSASKLSVYPENGGQTLMFLQSVPLSVSGSGGAAAAVKTSIFENNFSNVGEDVRLQVFYGDACVIESGKMPGDIREGLVRTDHGYFLIREHTDSILTYRCALNATGYLDSLRSTRRLIVGLLFIELFSGGVFIFLALRHNFRPIRNAALAVEEHAGIGSDGNELERIVSGVFRVAEKSDEMRLKYMERLPILRSELLRRLMTGAGKVTAEMLCESGIRLPYPDFAVMLVYCGPEESAGELLESVILDSALCYACPGTDGQYLTLVNGEKNKLYSAAEEITQYLYEKIGSIPLVAYGGEESNLNGLPWLLARAEEAAQYAVAWNLKGLTRARADKEGERFAFTSPMEQQLERILKSGSFEQACSFLSGLFESLSGASLRLVRLTAYGVTALMARILTEWEREVPMTQFEEAIYSDNADEIRSRMISSAKSVCETALEVKEKRAPNIVRPVLDLIEKEFSSPDFSLADAAEALGLTASYLSHSFKQASGVNFIDALAARRIEEAKKLLTQNSLEIYSVAEKCGYSGAGYFSRVFKKTTGLTPAAYREEHGNKP